MRKKKEKDPINILYMIKKIYPMCFKPNPLDCIFTQTINFFSGVATGADVMVTQIFFDSVYNASTGKGTVNGAVVALILYIALKLAIDILEGMLQFFVNAQ